MPSPRPPRHRTRAPRADAVGMLNTSYERDGYDGMRGSTKWWFEGWGGKERDESWTKRKDAGRPPTPRELAMADHIIFGFEDRRGNVTYKTHVGGIDVSR